MPTYVFAVQLDRRPSDAEVEALWVAAGGAAHVSRDERYAVLRYSRDAHTLSHAIAATIDEIIRLPDLHAWWVETHR